MGDLEIIIIAVAILVLFYTFIFCLCRISAKSDNEIEVKKLKSKVYDCTDCKEYKFCMNKSRKYPCSQFKLPKTGGKK